MGGYVKIEYSDVPLRQLLHLYIVSRVLFFYLKGRYKYAETLTRPSFEVNSEKQFAEFRS